MPKQKSNLQDATDVRELIREMLRPHLTAEQARRDAAEATGLTYNTICSMLYSANRGGIRAWQLLYLHVHDLAPAQWDSLLEELKLFLRKRGKMTDGQRKWASLGEKMTEEQRLYHSAVTKFLLGLDAPAKRRKR